ncbi:MAG: peptidylprolyl isomerase [Pseudomonadota bacterium]|nr:peptidylprolyl isomerase [Pseudomonadota bacterium]
MRIMMTAATLAAVGLTSCATTTSAQDAPRVVIETEAGRMVVELDLARAPLSTCNFLSYVTDGDYDGGRFFRTVVRATNTGNPHPIDVIQAATPRGDDDDLRPPIPLERTRDTGLSHVAGTVSMARNGPDTATSSFFIVTQDTPALDFGGGRNPDGQGFAAFGRVVEGLEVARRIQMSPANSEERLTPPVAIRSTRIEGQVPPGCHP